MLVVGEPLLPVQHQRLTILVQIGINVYYLEEN